MKLLSYQQRSQAYLHLASQNETETHIISNLKKLGENKDYHIKQCALNTAIKMAHRKSLGDAGIETGLFSPSDGELINIAQKNNKISLTLKYLADRYGNRAELIEQLKNQLVLPLAILLLSTCLTPLPSFITNTITFKTYLSQTFFLSCGLLLIVFTAIKLPQLLQYAPLKKVKLFQIFLSFYKLLPGFGKQYLKYKITLLFEKLALMLQSDIPLITALDKSLIAIGDNAILKSFEPVISRLHHRYSLADAISINPYISKNLIALVRQGEEQTNVLHEFLIQYCQKSYKKMNTFNLKLSQTLSWVIYLFAFILVVSGILNSTLF